MNTNISAKGLRQWAAQCETRAKDPLTTGPEYERLMTMKAALLALADTRNGWTARPDRPIPSPDGPPRI